MEWMSAEVQGSRGQNGKRIRAGCAYQREQPRKKTKTKMERSVIVLRLSPPHSRVGEIRRLISPFMGFGAGTKRADNANERGIPCSAY